MKKLTKFYPLSISLGLILLIFDLFNKYQAFRITGKILIVISIILFFIKYAIINKKILINFYNRFGGLLWLMHRY